MPDGPKPKKRGDAQFYPGADYSEGPCEGPFRSLRALPSALRSPSGSVKPRTLAGSTCQCKPGGADALAGGTTTWHLCPSGTVSGSSQRAATPTGTRK